MNAILKNKGCNNKQIIIILSTLLPGGAERTIVTLANSMAKEYRVSLAVVRRIGSLESELSDAVRLVDLGGRLKWFFTFPLLVRRLKPKVVLSTLWDVNLWVLSLSWIYPIGTKVVVRDAVMPRPVLNNTKFPKVVTFFYRFLYVRAEAVIALSESMKSEIRLITYLPEDKVVVIRNALNHRYIDISKSDITIGSQPYLIAVGRLERQKGFDVLIRVFSRIRAIYPDYQLWILGEGGQRIELARLIKQLSLSDVAQLPGYINNPFPLIANARMLILSSHYEGLPNAVIEALCLGTPVLGSIKNTGVEEIIKHGVNGFLIDKSNDKSLLMGLCEALENIDKLDRKAIAARARSSFSIDRMLEDYKNVLI
ncbi:MAG: glycosyltransferase [Pseudomonadota bacterium]